MSREYEIHLIKEKVKELEGNVFPITHFAEKNGEGVLICLPFTPAILADMLRKRKEVVIDLYGIKLWLRETYAQALEDDKVLIDCYKELAHDE